MPAKHAVRISNDTRAVTTSIGYILTFAVLLAAITVIAATGTTIVTDQEAAANTDQAITDINTVASNIDAATTGHTGPVTSTHIDTDHGDVHAGPDTHIKVNVTDTSTGDAVIHTFNTTAITRQTTHGGDTRYIGGGGIHTTTNGESTITHHPGIRAVDDDRVVVTMNNVTSGAGNTAFGGGHGEGVTVTAEHEHTVTDVVRSDGEGEGIEVTVTVTGETAAAWETVFREAGFERVNAATGDDDSLSWRATTSEVRVRIPHVTIT